MIGYSSGSVANFRVINDFNIWELNYTAGTNTGVNGTWIFPLFTENSNYDADEQCNEWYRRESRMPPINLVNESALNSCPCTHDQATSNWRFRSGFRYHSRSRCTYLWWPRRRSGFRWGIDPLGTVECCYDDNGSLIKSGSKAGTSKKFHFRRGSEAVDHIYSDLLPYNDCCVNNTMSQFCTEKYHKLRIPDDCSSYDATTCKSLSTM